MIKLGLTGGIGSGKTTVAKVFETLGVPVFFADDEAKKFLFSNEVKSQLVELFGSSIINEAGEINKAELASIVFNDKESLKMLNSLIHPLLMQSFNSWVSEKSQEKHQYIVMEAAILFEAGFDSEVDKVLCVSAPIEDRVNRVVGRDGASKQQVYSRLNNQMSDKERELKSDFVIQNSNKDMIVEAVVKIDTELKN